MIRRRVRVGRFLTPIRMARSLTLLVISLIASDTLHAYTTESREVRAMVQRGVEFLSSSNVDSRLGGRCIVGLVLIKQNLRQHELVVEAIRACEEACSRPVNEIDEDIYSTGLAIVFLCELDAEEFRANIERLTRSLLLRQRNDGAWGYPPDTLSGRSGDTSMTQYAVLGLWTAQNHGVNIPTSAFVDVTNWLLRTQDPSGGWGYHAKDPGQGNFRRVAQSNVRHSLCAAANGSLYICLDALGAPSNRQGRVGEKENEKPLPPALKLVQTNQAGNPRPIKAHIDMQKWRGAVRDGKAWFATHSYEPSPAWPNYYLYALERYRAFLELTEPGAKSEWYDVGVEFLARKQQRDGSWNGQGGREVSTAFAVLFLTRSTRQAIRGSDYGEGRLTGGRGLPRSVANVRLKKGRIVSTSLGVSVKEALSALENPGSEAYGLVTEIDESLVLSDDPTQRPLQLDRLRRIAKSGSHRARAIAIRMLSHERSLDDFSLFLDALLAPDETVRQRADEALRRLSRKLDGVDPAGVRSSNVDRRQAWQRWYLTIRPEQRIY